MEDKIERLAHILRKGHNIAIVAVARKLLGYIYIMMNHNIRYQDLQIHKRYKNKTHKAS